VSGRLQGKRVLVTGGARGQGAAEVALFAREGAGVVFGDIRHELGRSLESELRAEGLAVHYVELDVSDETAWAGAVTFAGSELGGIDVLVNNAGIVAFAGATEVSNEEWARVISVNQTGTLLGMRSVIPEMVARGAGSVVNIASVFGLRAVPGYLAYQATKGAIIRMSRAAAVEYAPSGVRVNSICPGLILTDMSKDEPPELIQANLDETPLGRAGTVEEIAFGALYLASDESSFVTGIELVIDGGYLAR
jgi:NAD(P)-dependent dehydrogenase (short-subunit alcohol dehydrogenase family)